jgi:hypothetical protein
VLLEGFASPVTNVNDRHNNNALRSIPDRLGQPPAAIQEFIAAAA